MEKPVLHRVFFAVDVMPWQAILKEWQNFLHFQLSAFEHGVTWRPSDSLHLTLLFLGELHPDKVSLIKQCMQGFIFPEAVILDIERIGLLNQKYIVIFVKANSLIKLKQRLVAHLQDAGLPLNNEKPFVSHITLGHISKKILKTTVTELFNQFNGQQLKPFNIHEIGLYRSFPANNYPLVQNFQI
jgi:2'-5' RNA ligase